MLDVILLPAMKIDGFFVHENERAWEIDFTDDIGLAGYINNHEIVASDRAQADGVGRISFVSPVIVFAGEMQKTSFGKPCAEIGKVHVTELFIARDWQFKRRTFQMVDENLQIVRLDKGVLRRAAKEIIWMAHHELVEWGGRSYQHGARSPAAAPCAASALPCGGNRPGIACHHNGVE